MSDALIRRRLVVRGHVQGVLFRDSIHDCAERAGVAGWARNEPDGTVTVVLEGSEDGVQRVVEFCRQGPSRARVADVDVATEDPEGLTGFEIR